MEASHHIEVTCSQIQFCNSIRLFISMYLICGIHLISVTCLLLGVAIFTNISVEGLISFCETYCDKLIYNSTLYTFYFHILTENNSLYVFLKHFAFERHIDIMDVCHSKALLGERILIPITGHEDSRGIWMQGSTFTEPQH